MNDIDVSPFSADVEYVTDGRTNIQTEYWTAEVTARGKKVEVLKILNVDIQEYYENHYSQILTLDLMMGAGQYNNILYPGQDDINVNLIRRSVAESKLNDDGTISGVNETAFYTAVLVDQGQHGLQDAKQPANDTIALDLSNIMIVRLQLKDKAEEQLRLLRIGGNYRQTTVELVLQAVMTNAIKQVDAVAQLIPKGIQLVKPDNEKIYEQICVPDSLPLVDLPGYLQKHYGVYNTGLSHFVKNGIWYLFPTYDVERGSQAYQTLQISLVSKKHYPRLSATYKVRGTSIMIVSSSDRRTKNIGTTELGNKGNGVKYLDGSMLIDGMVDTSKPNKAIIDSSKNVNEFVVYNKPDGLNNVPLTTGTGITSNQHYELSKIAARAGTYLMMAWDFSDPNLLSPGLLATIKFSINNKIREAKGVLVSAVHTVKLYDPSFACRDYYTQSALTFFLNQSLDLEQS